MSKPADPLSELKLLIGKFLPRIGPAVKDYFEATMPLARRYRDESEFRQRCDTFNFEMRKRWDEERKDIWNSRPLGYMPTDAEERKSDEFVEEIRRLESLAQNVPRNSVSQLTTLFAFERAVDSFCFAFIDILDLVHHRESCEFANCVKKAEPHRHKYDEKQLSAKYKDVRDKGAVVEHFGTRLLEETDEMRPEGASDEERVRRAPPTRDELTLLRELACADRTLTQAELEDSTKISRKTVGKLLISMQSRQLVCRPRGERGGSAITVLGRECVTPR